MLAQHKMTERYDRNIVNSRHAVAFSKPTVKENLHYFDFDNELWRRVEPLDNLPYNLCSYRFLDEPEEKCVVTCHDSYRLTTDPDSEPDAEEMWEEKSWRDEIVKKEAEFDYIDNDGKGYRAKVCWTKADIIPGVIVGGPRQCPNLNGFGYVYKESRCFDQSGSFFELLTTEELEKERQEDEVTNKQRKDLQDKIHQIKQTLSFYSRKGYEQYEILGIGSLQFYDTLPYYQTLKKFPDPITFELLKDYLKDAELTDQELAFVGLLTFAKNYDLCYYNTQQEVQKEFSVPQGVIYTTKEALERAKRDYEPSVILKANCCDVIFDIHVHGGTYARLHCGDYDPDNQWGRDFDLIKVNETFTFPDVTINNPLSVATAGSILRVYTDGDRVTWNCGIYQPETLNIMASLCQAWRISYLQGRVLLNGNMWAPSMSFPVEDLIQVEDTLSR